MFSENRIEALLWKLVKIDWDKIQRVGNVYYSEKLIGKYRIVQETSDILKVTIYENDEVILSFCLVDGKIDVEYVNDNFYKMGDEVWN